MNTKEFISELSSFNKEVQLYPIAENFKLLSRFWAKLFWLPNLDKMKSNWLNELYSNTNGIDIKDAYIAPYNKHFNKKKYSFDELCREWIVDQNNPNEILADFCAFMTNGKYLIGYLDNLTDRNGNNFIAYSSKIKNIKDVTVISSSIFSIYEYILFLLEKKSPICFPEDLNFWRNRDKVLDEYYQNGYITIYKEKFLLQNESEMLENVD